MTRQVRDGSKEGVGGPGRFFGVDDFCEGIVAMMNPLNSFTDLPKPVQAASALASGAGIMTVFFAIQTNSRAWQIAAALLIGVGVIMVLFKLGLMLWDKKKSGPFSSLITRTAGGRGATDPAQKARMDDLRKKFEEGVAKFKASGKDLYSLPWYLVVGPPGSGKTEMVRRSNVGFPPGLQDVQQGAGGTMNMNWWFTNHAVMIDTAGRMFMEETEGQNTEWKEFLKLLRTARPNCPINGLLLVIPSESLLKDTEEKIEKTAGAIARQLDVIQRILEVRFPVTVVVTKCDKIVGFREFFEAITDPILQHQILGWSNPASLDDVFKPEEVSKHIDAVREKLTRRRAGLLQNPVHTVDASGRRVDEVDEMIELPGNLVRISPRLRLYLEKIFLAGEWSPKPLFLRGIYFTSSMREGQALDVALAAALGVDPESLSGGKEYEKEKAYFLKDVFLGKVFKERGLVTRATHVGKAVDTQRRWLVGATLVATLLVGGATLASAYGYISSFKIPNAQWREVWMALRADAEAKKNNPKDASPLAMFWSADSKFEYKGKDKPGMADVPDGVEVRSDLLKVTGEQTTAIRDPLVAKPVLYMLDRSGLDFVEKQVEAHRAVVESKVLMPLLDEVRRKLRDETSWDATAVAATAQLVRLTTSSEGKEPMAAPYTVKQKGEWELVDVEALAQYALGEGYSTAFPGGKNDPELLKLKRAVGRAYPLGWSGGGDAAKSGASESLFNNDRAGALDKLTKALASMSHAVANKAAGGDTGLGRFDQLIASLQAFDEAEGKYQEATAWLAAEAANSPSEAVAKAKKAGYDTFAAAYRLKVKAVDDAKDECVRLASKYKDEDLENTEKLLAAVQAERADEIDKMIKALREQLPVKSAAAVPAVSDKVPAPVDRVAKLEQMLDDANEASVSKAMRGSLAAQVQSLRDRLKPVGALLSRGDIDGTRTRLFEALHSTHRVAVGALTEGEKVPTGDPSVSASLLARKREAVAKAKDYKDALEKRKLWNAERLAKTVNAAQRVVGIAQMRAMYGLADAAIGEAVWNDGASLEVGVAGLKDEMLRGDDPTKRIVVKSPKVAMSILEEGVTYKREFLPEAAAVLVGAWGEVRKLTDNAALGDAGAVAREELRAKISQGARGDNAVADYVKKYANYWTRMACEDAMPKVASWAEFKANLTVLGQNKDELEDALVAVRDRSVGAFDTVTAAAGPMAVLDTAKKQVMTDFAGMGGVKSLKNLIDAWVKLCANGADQSVIAIRRAIEKGEFTQVFATNFGGQGENANYLKYRDQLVLRGLNAIAAATAGDVERAWQNLSNTKGIPLATGIDRELDAAEMTTLVNAVKAFGKPGAKSQQTDIGKGVKDPQLLEAVKGVLGDDHMGSDERVAWMTRVNDLLETFAKPVKVTVRFWEAEPPVRGAAGRAGDKFGVAGLWLGGKLVSPDGRLTNIGTGGPSMVLEMSVPTAESVEIRLFAADPMNVPKAMDAPDGRISLTTGRWGPLKALLEDASRVVNGTDGKSFNVKLPSAQGFVWITISLEAAAGVPKLPTEINDWPNAANWPPK